MGGTAGARMTDFFVNMPQQTQACHEAPWMDPSTQQPSWLPGMEQVPTADYVRTLTTWHKNVHSSLYSTQASQLAFPI